MSLLELTAVELAKEIKAGKTTAVEAMKAVLEQIEKTEETYHSCGQAKISNAKIKKKQCRQPKKHRKRLKPEH